MGHVLDHQSAAVDLQKLLNDGSFANILRMRGRRTPHGSFGAGGDSRHFLNEHGNSLLSACAFFGVCFSKSSFDVKKTTVPPAVTALRAANQVE